MKLKMEQWHYESQKQQHAARDQRSSGRHLSILDGYILDSLNTVLIRIHLLLCTLI